MLKLDNPKQQRTLAKIVADLPGSVKVEAAKRIVRVNRLIAEQQKFDAAVEAALDRIQRAKQLQRRIKRTKEIFGA